MIPVYGCLVIFGHILRNYVYKNERHIEVSKCLSSVYRQISNMRSAFVGNTIVDHSDEAPVGAAPTSSFST